MNYLYYTFISLYVNFNADITQHFKLRSYSCYLINTGVTGKKIFQLNEIEN